MKNKYFASFLAFFLGAIGAHKFYLGDEKWGFVFLAYLGGNEGSKYY